jgi:hypothetical protein
MKFNTLIQSILKYVIYKKKKNAFCCCDRFKFSKKMFKQRQSEVKYYRKKISSYVSAETKITEFFETWEELSFCLLNTKDIIGKESPKELYYITVPNKKSFGVIGHLMFYETHDYNQKNVTYPVLYNPVFAICIHPFLSSKLLEKGIKETQLENISKKSANKDAFKSSEQSEDVSVFFEQHLKDITQFSDEHEQNNIIFGNIKQKFDEICFKKIDGIWIPFNKDMEEILIDIRRLPNNKYYIINDNGDLIGNIVLSNGKVKEVSFD